MSNILKGVGKGKPFDLAIMDFSKDYDVVPHKHLLKKIQYYGIKASCLDWIKDFMMNRSQRVKNTS